MKKGILVLFFACLLPGQGAFATSQTESDKKAVPAKLTLNVVRQVVRSHLEEVQKCYTDLIIENMASKGKVIATWDIDDKGAVQNLTIKDNTSKSQALEGCVTEKVVNWNFPPAESGKTFQVSYPFEFH